MTTHTITYARTSRSGVERVHVTFLPVSAREVEVTHSYVDVDSGRHTTPSRTDWLSTEAARVEWRRAQSLAAGVCR